MYELRSIPSDIQDGVEQTFGVQGVVELAALVGLYHLIGGMVAAFDVQLEPTLAAPDWA